MVLSAGDKVHIITRRLFEGDLRRHFAGVVDQVSGEQITALGYVFIFDEANNQFVRREEQRLRIFAIGDSGLIVNLLPKETDLAEVRYEIDQKGRRVVTDGKHMILNISEFGAKR